MPLVNTRTLGLLTLVLGSVGALQADLVCVANGPCGQNWQPFQTPIQHAQAPGPRGPVYFDGFSWDAPDANIAYFIEGQGAFLGNPASPGAPLPYWGNPNGSAVSSFYFQSGGVPQIATLVLADSQWAPDNSLGWYDPNSSAWGWIFQANGSSPQVPQTVEFTPTSNFDLFFVPDSLTYPAPEYSTNSALNGIAAADVAYAQANNISLGPESAYQHFAVFQDGASYYIGVKDRSLQVGDGDYNDMVIKLTPSPEPRYWLPVGALFIALFCYRRVRGRVS